VKTLLSALGKPIVWYSLAVLVAVLLVVGQCNSRNKLRASVANQEVAEAQAGLGQSAAEKTAEVTDLERQSAQTERANREAIQNAGNANETAGEAGDRGRAALCRRVQYRDTPQCAQLRQPDRSNPPR